MLTLFIILTIFLYLCGYCMAMGIIYEDQGYSLDKIDFIIALFWWILSLFAAYGAIKAYLYARKEQRYLHGISGEYPVDEEPCIEHD